MLIQVSSRDISFKTFCNNSLIPSLIFNRHHASAIKLALSISNQHLIHFFRNFSIYDGARIKPQFWRREKELLRSTHNPKIPMNYLFTKGSVRVIMNQGGKFIKKLWCCVGGRYFKIIWLHVYQSSCCKLAIVKSL